MVYRWSKITRISITSVGVVLVVFPLWATFVTTSPVEQFQEDPKFATQCWEYYQDITVFGRGVDNWRRAVFASPYNIEGNSAGTGARALEINSACRNPLSILKVV